MKLNDDILHAFEAHALSCYPEEACGLVVNDQYVPCTNTADDPLKDFRVDGAELIKARAAGSLQAVLHSHPYSSAAATAWPPEWPSGADMESWLADIVPWGIAATDGEGFTKMVWLDDANPEPLIGREFIHGVNDCYSLVRDWYRLERGITLKNYPRTYGWWSDNKNLYAENFASAGFEEIPLESLQIGDAVLMRVGSGVIRHAAVVTGHNEITHHMFHRFSGTDSLSKWNRCIAKAVRFNPDLVKEQE